MEWAIGLLLYLAYVVVFSASRRGQTVTGLRALTLFPAVLPLMLLWWIVGRAKFYRSGDKGFAVGIDRERLS